MFLYENGGTVNYLIDGVGAVAYIGFIDQRAADAPQERGRRES